jgi:hypothetical protein
MMRLVRVYQSDKGIWHYEFERNGKVYWASLRTRNATAAIHKLAGIFYESSRSCSDHRRA